jgi:hypothetical protein
MLDSRLKRALVEHLGRGVRAVGERSLAILISAGVAASCGGQTDPGDASTDQKSNDSHDDSILVEAPNFDAGAKDANDSGVIVEAPNFDSGVG